MVPGWRLAGLHERLHRESHLGRHETYHADFRLWRWRVGGEQLLYSHMDQVYRNVHNSPPGYTLNKIRQFIAAGEVDNYNFTGIYSATMKMVGVMGHTPGQRHVPQEHGTFHPL